MNRHCIISNASLREAFARLNEFSGENMTLFVIEPDGCLVGSLTDGDLRRAIIGGATLEENVSIACNKGCMIVKEDSDKYQSIAEAKKRGVSLLPEVKDGKIVGLLDLHRLKTSLPIDAVLMAGGRGERLRPLTLDCPKPLLKVGGKAIIDHNVDELLANGVTRIFVTVNYLKEQIRHHFDSPEYAGKVRCVEEPRRLGTMGSLSLCEGLGSDTILVMNSDLLTTLNFEKMWLSHISSGAALTMATIPYSVSVPFAIVEAEGREVRGLTEKPTYNYFANAGVYMMRRDIALGIPHGEYLDAPDLIQDLIEKGEKVEYFPVDGTWIDIGSPDDYRQACRIASLSMGTRFV